MALLGGCAVIGSHAAWLSRLGKGAEDLGQRLELSWWEIAVADRACWEGKGELEGCVCSRKIRFAGEFNRRTGLWEALDSAASKGLKFDSHTPERRA